MFWFFLGAFLLLLFSSLPHFPEKAFIFSGDIYTPLFGEESFFSSLSQDEVRGFLWYGFFWITENLALDRGTALQLYLFLFFLLSYGSFWFSAKKIFTSLHPFVLFSFAFLYAFNPFTGILFASGKLFSVLGVLYGVLPLLLVGYWSFLQKPTIKNSLFFIFWSFVAGTALLFPTYLLTLGIFFGIFTLLGWLFLEKKCSWKFFLSIFLLWGSVFLIQAYALPSTFMRLFYGEGVSFPQSKVELFLGGSSYSITDVFRLTEPYFTWSDSASSLGGIMMLLLVGVSFFPLLWIVIGWLTRKTYKEKRLFWFFLTLFLFCGFLTIGSFGRFGFLYQSIFGFFEKSFFLEGKTFSIFLPFLGIFLGLLVSQFQNVSRKIFTVSALILSFSALPFFLITNLQSENEEALETKENMQSIALLEEDYFSLREYLYKNSSDDTKGAVAMFPYEEESSLEKKYFEKNILPSLVQREIIPSQSPYFGSWSHTKTFSQSTEDPEWIVLLLGRVNVEYVLWYKTNSEEDLLKKEFLSDKKVWENVMETETFSLYQIADRFTFPLLYVSEKPFALVENPSSILALEEEMTKEKRVAVSYEESFGKYTFFVDSENSGKTLVFSRPFHFLWEAKFSREDSSYETLPHIRSLGLLNGWKLPEFSHKAKVEIVFLPMKFFFLGMLVTGITMLCAIMIGIAFYLKKKLYAK
ncbi:MAG: hypothetical protein EOM19_01145 [Candidatus Moranbacteria bacterium]|nr:hypothetical protein [Candidatus Moranbacteria bacterium]